MSSSFAFKKQQQRSRQQEAARRSTRTPSQEAAPRSILRRAGQQRVNNRNVKISATCTARAFDKTLPPHCVKRTFLEEVQSVVVEGRVSRKGSSLQREVAALSSDLGVYRSEPSPRRLRRSRRATKAPERFVP